MDKSEAVELIDKNKNALIDPVEMLHWTWLRVIINNVDDAAWDAALAKATETLSG